MSFRVSDVRFLVGPVQCLECGYRAVSVRPVEAPDLLECPRCREMAMAAHPSERYPRGATMEQRPPLNLSKGLALVACLLFVLAAFGVTFGIGLGWLGLAFLAGAVLFG